MKKAIILIVIILVVIGVGWAVSQRSGSVAKVEGPIKVGVIESLSGPATYYGEQNKKGVDLAIADLKEKYPKLKFVALHEDSKYNGKDGLNAYNKLKAEGGVDAVITHASPVAMSIKPVAARDGILQMAVSASAAGYSSPDDLSVRVSPTTQSEVKVMTEHVVKQGYKKNWRTLL